MSYNGRFVTAQSVPQDIHTTTSITRGMKHCSSPVLHMSTVKQNGHHLCRENLFQLSSAIPCLGCHYRLLSIAGVSRYTCDHLGSKPLYTTIPFTLSTFHVCCHGNSTPCHHGNKGGKTEWHACNKVVYNSQHLATTTDRWLLSICVVFHHALVCDGKQL